MPNDILQALLQGLMRGGSTLMEQNLALNSPEVYRQQQENRRLGQQLAAQLGLHQTMTPYEQAQLELARQGRADTEHQQSFENQMRVAGGISSGALQQVYGPSSSTPFDSSAPGQDVLSQLGLGSANVPGFDSPSQVISAGGLQAVPQAPTSSGGYTIKATDPIGRFYNYPHDVTGLTAEQFVKASQQFKSDKDAYDNTATAKAQLELDKQRELAALGHRFGPEHSVPLYGKVDPTAAANLEMWKTNLESVSSLKELQDYRDRLLNFHSDWEAMRLKDAELKNQLAAKLAMDGDPHLISTQLAMDRRIDEVLKPRQDEWDEGQNILNLAKAKNQQNDAALFQALSPYITGVKRFNKVELDSLSGGATAWENMQRELNRFRSNPNSARIPDAQRDQIISMILTKQGRLKAEIDKINNAQDDLIDAKTSADVMRVHARLSRQLGTDTPATGGGRGPAPGTVVGGYRFRGGDPNAKENWIPASGRR